MSQPQAPATPRRVIIVLIIIIVAAACLRTYGLRHLVYTNPDEAVFSYFVVRIAGLSPVNPHPADNAVANLYSWDYGWPLYTVDYLYLRALQALRLPIYEATLALPTVLFGCLNCLMIYLLGAKFGSRRAGLIAAALVATMPIMVGRSRSIGAGEACSGFLLMLAALQIIRYLQQPTDRKREWLAGVCLGFYVCGDLQLSVGGTVLLLLTVLWPRAEGYEGFQGWRRLVIRPGTLLPPLLIFAPYLPVYLYASHLGYADQTFIGSLRRHHPDWGFHLSEFLPNLALNMGLAPLFVTPIAAYALRGRLGDGRVRWLLAWVALTAFPFVFAVSFKITQASGYHQHLVAGLALLLGLALAALRPRALGTAVAAAAVAGALFFTAAGILRLPALTPYWPSEQIPYGGLTPNNGMKTAGYWVRQNVSPRAGLFCAHDPKVAGWYLGRDPIIGGYGTGMERTGSFLQAKDKVSVAVIPDQQEFYPPALFKDNGFAGRIIVRSGGREVLDIYTRTPRQLTLDTEQYDPLYTQAYHTSQTIVPPGSGYVPGKRVKE